MVQDAGMLSFGHSFCIVDIGLVFCFHFAVKDPVTDMARESHDAHAVVQGEGIRHFLDRGSRRVGVGLGEGCPGNRG